MLVKMRPGAAEEDHERVLERLQKYKLQGRVIYGAEQTAHGVRSIIPVLGGIKDYEDIENELKGLHGVDEVYRISTPYKLVSREYPPHDLEVKIGGKPVGNNNGLFIIAGNCAVEDEGWVMETAYALKEAGADALRGGVIKPRSSPYSFEGLREDGVKIMV